MKSPHRIKIEEHASSCNFDNIYICSCGARARNLERYLNAVRENDMPDESLRGSIEAIIHPLITRETHKGSFQRVRVQVVDAILTLIHSEKVKAGEKVEKAVKEEAGPYLDEANTDAVSRLQSKRHVDAAHRAVEEIRKETGV